MYSMHVAPELEYCTLLRLKISNNFFPVYNKKYKRIDLVLFLLVFYYGRPHVSSQYDVVRYASDRLPPLHSATATLSPLSRISHRIGGRGSAAPMASPPQPEPAPAEAGL